MVVRGSNSMKPVSRIKLTSWQLEKGNICLEHLESLNFMCRWSEAREDLQKALALEAAEGSENGPSSILLNNLGDFLACLASLKLAFGLLAASWYFLAHEAPC